MIQKSIKFKQMLTLIISLLFLISFSTLTIVACVGSTNEEIEEKYQYIDVSKYEPRYVWEKITKEVKILLPIAHRLSQKFVIDYYDSNDLWLYPFKLVNIAPSVLANSKSPQFKRMYQFINKLTLLIKSQPLEPEMERQPTKQEVIFNPFVIQKSFTSNEKMQLTFSPNDWLETSWQNSLYKKYLKILHTFDLQNSNLKISWILDANYNILFKANKQKILVKNYKIISNPNQFKTWIDQEKWVGKLDRHLLNKHNITTSIPIPANFSYEIETIKLVFETFQKLETLKQKNIFINPWTNLLLTNSLQDKSEEFEFGRWKLRITKTSKNHFISQVINRFTEKILFFVPKTNDFNSFVDNNVLEILNHLP